jgi:hypothetical protein
VRLFLFLFLDLDPAPRTPALEAGWKERNFALVRTRRSSGMRADLAHARAPATSGPVSDSAAGFTRLSKTGTGRRCVATLCRR